MTLTGDVLLKTNFDGNTDIEYQNGQPVMTDGFESFIILSIFGEDGPWNGMSADPAERMDSDFPRVIKRATVSDETRENGTAALQRALKTMIDIKAASRVTVVGRILSASAIGWMIEVEAPNGSGGKYEVNWEKGSLTVGYKRIA
jgi:hypothetical protein